jgi:elongation factor Ts
MNIELVRKLRDETGCGLVQAKKILDRTDWDYHDALAIALREILETDPYASHTAENGRIEQYAHTGNRLGVLVEINCQTDFAANTDEFKEFCQKIAMQIAAMNPQFMDIDEVDKSTLCDITMKFHRWAYDLAGDYSNEERNQRVQERLERWHTEVCLLAQRSIHDHTISVEEMRAGLAQKLGENIVIRRWVRWELGE